MAIVKRTRLITMLAAAASLMAIPAVVVAQAPVGPRSESVMIEEIIVTAQRREQDLQKVPLSVTALSARDIEEMGFTDSVSIGDQVPNLEFKTIGGTLNITIRGVGNNDFNTAAISPVSVYRDGVVIGANAPQTFALLDLDHVEVLRGPQGTLFGKNTTGGALQYFSKLPGDEMDGHIRLGYGRFDLYHIEGAATLPLGEDFAVRVAGLWKDRNGTKTNLFNNEKVGVIDEQAFRAIFRYNPGDLDARLHFGLGKAKNDNNELKAIGTLPGGTNAVGWNYPDANDLDVWNFDAQSHNEIEDTYAILDIAYAFGAFTLRSITGYDEGSGDYLQDSDASPLSILDRKLNLAETEQFTQELQLSYQSDKLDAVVGVYYFTEDYDYDLRLLVFGLLGPTATGRYYTNTRENDAYAAFVQGTYALSDRMRVTAGLRYTYDEVKATAQDNFRFGVYLHNPDPSEFIPVLPLTADDYDSDALDWRLALEYDLADDLMAYGSITKGSKAGGSRAAGVVNSPAELGNFDPEELISYEIGLKSTWFDQRLRVNASAFLYDYTDLQVQSVRTGVGGMTSIIVENAADADIKGLEVEITGLLSDQLELGLNFGVIDGEYENYVSGALDEFGNLVDFSGNKLPNTPEFSMSANLVYSVNLGNFALRMRADYSYTDKKYTNSAEDPLVNTLEGHDLLNLRASITPVADGRWELAVWGQNVTGEEYIEESLDLRSLGFINYQYGETEATYGVDFTYRF